MPFVPARAMPLALGLCGTLLSSQPSAAAAESEHAPLELDSTEVLAENLGTRTEGTGAYTTGAMSTATRLPLTIRETPQSVSVVTRQQMDDFKLGTLSEALQQSPGVVVQRLDSERVGYTARGYSIENFQYDGMLNTFSRLKPDSDTIIYDRIEVVRGATGLTTGAGNPSATVNMVRKRPTQVLQAKAGVSGGSYDNYYSYLDAGGPLGLEGRLRGRGVLAYQDSQSIRDHYAQQREVAYGVLEADLTDDTLLAVGFDYQNKHVQGSTWGTLPYWNVDGNKARLPRSANLSAPWSSWPVESRTTFVTLDQELGRGWKLKGAYTHRHDHTDGKTYYGGSGYPAADGTGMSAWYSHFIGDNRMEDFDLNLNGPYPLFGQTHELMIGYGKAQYRSSEPLTRDAALPPDYATIPNWRDMSGIPKFSDTVSDLPAYKSQTRQKAGYLATRLALRDDLHAVLGGRYGSWKSEQSEMTYTDDYTLAQRDRSSQTQNDQWTPYAGLLYDLTPELTLYASYTNIFRPQNVRDVNRRYLDPVIGKHYELGFKAAPADGRLNLSSAVFRSKQDNLAEIDDSIPQDPATGESFYKSGGKGNVIQGFEMELGGALLPDWNINASYTYTHSRNGEKQRLNTNQPLNLMRLSSTYRLPGEWRNLTVGGGISWQSDIFRTGRRPVGVDRNGKLITRPTPIRQDSYALFKLMARYDIDSHLTASLNVDNLLDKKYYDNVGFYNGVYWGDPRTLTLSLDWRL
ncbi:TonB-dependent siderophore receptor [Pseudomonas aeruginosa]|uniref:TonB-dependent siderophore receptor n=1 Tax=Pseudomonas aeruginosa TaxID=287 RepID=UPI001BCA5591|nr:TonB-dependent siderophore receptor [Pseudomonas aeruginosa]HCE6896112.1 TonB-dependent siderophore receptor [Pseudomonas aeruginosa]HCE6903658.1 TonB-dependent siderophore receptor [Pseudomonas aeruginosa]HCE7020228.1 TonB-dependent siderophore receptor [Pseudomonas aeruginosa]HCE7064875.1 TonB-dependent siderophore receptor [Pseudomonas aeruginosa]HCE7347256.1 TonB-dependent siderophore receptor [Pseudomonas aeruginosa]